MTFDVKVIDGEGLPVPSVEVGARYGYQGEPGTWSVEHTDAAGHAAFRESHPEDPREVALFVSDEECGVYAVTDGLRITVEM